MGIGKKEDITTIQHSRIQSTEFRRRDGDEDRNSGSWERSAAYAPLDPPVTHHVLLD